MVKGVTAELFREQRELVERLNAMHRRIEAEKDAIERVRRKIEWMEEKERCVEMMSEVHPSPHSTPPRKHPAAAAVGTCEGQNLPWQPPHRSLRLCKARSRRTRRVRNGVTPRYPAMFIASISRRKPWA